MKTAVAVAVKKEISPATKPMRPALILKINNGAAHTQAAKAIAAALENGRRKIPARVVEVSDYMLPLARFTHVTAYLWIVKNIPSLWKRIDNYQKQQAHTSPEWFYRKQCRRLFELVRETNPCALIATEVGCGEIAALIKRDLNLKISLVAVSLDYDIDRAWIQPEVDLYSLATESVRADFEKFGASPAQIRAWGIPMDEDFFIPNETEKEAARQAVEKQFGLEPADFLIAVGGGGEGLGKIDEIVQKLLAENFTSKINFIVLCGRNDKLKKKCEQLIKSGKDKKRFGILGWTENIAQIYRASDILISKLGNAFGEAMACGLPILAPPPPPGAEMAQLEMLKKIGAGIAIKNSEETISAVKNLLADRLELIRMKENAEKFGRGGAAQKIADWLAERIAKDDE